MKLIAPSGTASPVTTSDGTLLTIAVDGTTSTIVPSQIQTLLAIGFVPDLRDISQPPASLHFDRPMLPGSGLPVFLLCL